jgi:predicted transcriptional regulator
MNNNTISALGQKEVDIIFLNEYNVLNKKYNVFKEIQMSRTVTLRIEDNLYEKLKEHAQGENRNLSNFIETAVINYIEQIELADKHEMREILSNSELLERLNKGSLDAASKRGRFV